MTTAVPIEDLDMITGLPNIVLMPPDPSDDALPMDSSNEARYEETDEIEACEPSGQPGYFDQRERPHNLEHPTVNDDLPGEDISGRRFRHEREDGPRSDEQSESASKKARESKSIIFANVGEWHSTRAGRNRLCTRKVVMPTSCFVLMVLAIMGLLIAVVVVTTTLKSYRGGGNSPNIGNPLPTTKTLELITTRGKLNCGVVAQQGFSMINEGNGQWEGFEVDMVRFFSRECV